MLHLGCCSSPRSASVNYATKADLKGATGIDMFNLAVESDLARSKAEVDKIDVEK